MGVNATRETALGGKVGIAKSHDVYVGVLGIAMTALTIVGNHLHCNYFNVYTILGKLNGIAPFSIDFDGRKLLVLLYSSFQALLLDLLYTLAMARR
jgi:hypothetical protein